MSSSCLARQGTVPADHKLLVGYLVVTSLLLDWGLSAAVGERVMQSVTAKISPQGGSVTLQGVTTVTFLPKAFRSSQTVTVSATVSPETLADFEQTAEIFEPGPRLPYEVRINTSKVPPVKDFVVEIVVPEALAASLQNDMGLALFAQVFEAGGQEILDSFELFPSTYQKVKRIVRATLPREVFTNQRREDGTFEAIVILATQRKQADQVGPKGAESNPAGHTRTH